MAPRAVLPHDGQIAEIEGGRLGIGDIGLAGLVGEDATRRADAPGPAKIEHPGRHVKHMNARVAVNPVAVFGEPHPAPRMRRTL